MSKIYRKLSNPLVWICAALLVVSIFAISRVARAEAIDGEGDTPVVVADDGDLPQFEPAVPGEIEGDGDEVDDGEAEEPAALDIYIQVVGAPQTAAVGQTISYTIMLRNNGDPISGVQIVDELTGEVVATYDELDGNMKMISCSYTVTEADGEAGQVELSAIAVVLDGPTFSQPDQVIVTIGEAEEEPPAETGGEAAPQQQGGAPQGPRNNVPATGDASMLPAVVSAVSGLATLAGAALLRRRND